MTQDRQEGIVQAVRLVPCGSVVFFATVPAEHRSRIVTILWEHVRAKESHPWKRADFSSRVALPVQVVHGALGRPHLLLGESRGPAISFSTSGEEVWAALCGDESDIGIDVAGSDEFQEGYPLHRVFHVQELHQAMGLAGGNVAKAAALLWSIKEAVAKALGCAFHLLAPRDIHVHPSAAGGGGMAFSVRLSGKAMACFPMADRQPITGCSLPRAGTWLSIAALNWRWRGAVIH